MPRLYNPDVKTEYGMGLFDGIEYNTPVMKESKDGQWVKLQTFKDEQSRLWSIIKRQQKEIHRLKERP